MEHGFFKMFMFFSFVFKWVGIPLDLRFYFFLHILIFMYSKVKLVLNCQTLIWNVSAFISKIGRVSREGKHLSLEKPPTLVPPYHRPCFYRYRLFMRPIAFTLYCRAFMHLFLKRLGCSIENLLHLGSIL